MLPFAEVRPRILALSIVIDAAPETLSGFRPRSEQHGVPVFGMGRWEGFASALGAGLARSVTVIGGMEPLPAANCPDTPENKICEEKQGIVLVPRAYAAARFLRMERGCTEDEARWVMSPGNTDGNYAAIREMVKSDPDVPTVISAAYYHIPRSVMIAAEMGVAHIPHVPAEAFWFAREMRAGKPQDDLKNKLQDFFGGGAMGRRAAVEIAGCAARITGSYTPLSA